MTVLIADEDGYRSDRLASQNTGCDGSVLLVRVPLVSNWAAFYEHQAAIGHMQTARAMTEENGGLFDIEYEGTEIRFKTWRELVAIETSYMIDGRSP